MQKKMKYFSTVWMVLVFSTILHSEAANPYLDYLIRGDNSYYSGNFLQASELYDSARVLRPSESAPLVGLYHTSLKLLQKRSVADYAEKLYAMDSSAINLERRIFGNSFSGHWYKSLELAENGSIDQTYGYDLAGQGFYQGGYLLEAWRITDKAYKFNPEYPLLSDRKTALEDAISAIEPRFTFNNSSAYFKYQKHPILKDGWYNGFDVNSNYLAHSLNFNWSEQRFTARPFKQLTDSLVSTIHEEWESTFYVPFTGWDSTSSVVKDSGYVLVNHVMAKMEQPLQREFFLGYQYQIFTGWQAGVSYKYGFAENDIWKNGQTLNLSTALKNADWNLALSVSYSQIKLNDFHLSMNRIDSTYQYQQIWDSAYQNIDGNFEKDSLFYTYRNDFSIYKPQFIQTTHMESVWQINLAGGYNFRGLYLGGSGAIRNNAGEESWDWNYKTDLAYTFAGFTLWGAYSSGATFLFNTIDGKVLQTSVPKIKSAYETGVSWKLNRSWSVDFYYGDKKYTDYQQKLYLAGLTYNLFKN